MLIVYTDPASVQKIMDALGSTAGVNNTPDGLYVGELKIKKALFFRIEDGQIKSVNGVGV